MPRIRRARIGTIRRPIVEEKSIREFPLYKILKCAEGTERYRRQESQTTKGRVEEKSKEQKTQ